MFTLQANAITTALRGSGIPNESAQDMVNAMCNCAQTIEHRGSLDFTYQTPWSNNYPGLEPPAGRVGPYTPETGGRPSGQMLPQIAPWQNIPWYPIPWEPPATVTVPGPVQTGPLQSGPTTMTSVTNLGPTINYGPVFTNNETRVEGSMTVNNNTKLGDTTTQNITNEGDLFVDGDTEFGGPLVQLGPTFNAGPAFFGGPITIRIGDRVGRLQLVNLRYVRAVRFDPIANGLVAERRVARVLVLSDARLPDATVC